jgi:hypothetical protein
MGKLQLPIGSTSFLPSILEVTDTNNRLHPQAVQERPLEHTPG